MTGTQTDSQLTALIVDDEPLARIHVKQQLELQSVQIVGEAEDALEALRLTEDLAPNLVFLDIQMPGMSGMHVAEALLQMETAPLIIFVTSYSEYAVEAFERNALDYLLKPVSPERLATALIRARKRLSGPASQRQSVANMTWQAREEAPLRRLPIREDFGVRLVRIEEILYAAAREKRVFVATSSKEYRTYYTLTQLETLLPSEQFFRIHDGWLVNLDQVAELCFLGNHNYTLRLANKQQLPISRYRFADLQRRLGAG